MKQAQTLPVVGYQKHSEMFTVFTLPSYHILHNMKVSATPQFGTALAMKFQAFRYVMLCRLNQEDGSTKRLLNTDKHQAA
jgi:hypothetical protein